MIYAVAGAAVVVIALVVSAGWSMRPAKGTGKHRA